MHGGGDTNYGIWYGGTCHNPQTWEVEAGKLRLQGYLQLHTKFETSLDYIRPRHEQKQKPGNCKTFCKKYLGNILFTLLGNMNGKHTIETWFCFTYM